MTVDVMTTPIAPLYGYQLRWIADTAELKVGLWCRSAGKTFAMMLEAVIDCQEAEADGRIVNWYVFSGAEGQTKEMLLYAARHAQAIALAFSAFDEELEVDGEKYTQHVVQFAGGSRIVGLPTNPLSIRGRHGNVIWDEAGKTPNDEEIWAAAAPIASRKGFRMIVGGTAGPKRGPFYEMATGKRPGWSAHKITVYDAVADGAPIDIEKLKAAIGTGKRWKTEAECEFEDAESRLIALELIWQCETKDAALVPVLRVDAERRDWRAHLDANPLEPAPSEGYDDPAAWRRLLQPLAGLSSLFLGYDVARRRHLAVLWIVQAIGPVRRTVAVIALKGRRFAEQEAALGAAFERCQRGCLDSTGQGTQLAERMIEKYGEHKVEGVDFTVAVKEDLATRMLRGYEDRTQQIPADADIRDSINSVYKINTVSGHARYDADATEEAGHADYFWAQGLALLAAGDGGQGIPFLSSFGAPRFSRQDGIL